MDMKIAPALSDNDREHLRRARRTNGDPVLLAVISAALHIDQAEFRDAQIRLIDAVNEYSAHGAVIQEQANTEVAAVTSALKGHRYQVCALRSCLGLIDAIYHNCSDISVGERIGRNIQGMAKLIAEQSALRKAA